MSDRDRYAVPRRASIGISGGSYLLIGIGTTLAVNTWLPLFSAIITGIFWPATLAYWLLRALQQFAGG